MIIVHQKRKKISINDFCNQEFFNGDEEFDVHANKKLFLVPKFSVGLNKSSTSLRRRLGN